MWLPHTVFREDLLASTKISFACDSSEIRFEIVELNALKNAVRIGLCYLERDVLFPMLQKL